MTAGETLVIGASSADIQGMSMDKSGALLIQLSDGASLLIKNFAEIATAAGNSFITLPSGQTINLAELIQTLAPAATDEDVADATPTAQVLDHMEPAAGKTEAPAHVVVIGKPHAHENLVVKLHDGEDYKFSFNMTDPSSVKEHHGELVIAFKDGGEIIIPNYGTMKDAGLHDITMKDGTALSVSDLGDTLAQAAQLNEVEPAAGGRGAGAHGGGFGFGSVFSADALHSIHAIGPIGPTELHYNTFDRKPLEFAPQDDKPIANDDTNNFNGEDHTTTGNVITGENGGPGAADVLGNDQPDRITEVSFGTTTVTVPETGTVTITGDHGTLTIGSDGSYTYTLNDDAHGDTKDQFVYTLTDHDGDSDTAVLEIDSDGVPTIFNPNDPEESPGSRTVDETSLAPDTSVSGHLNADFYTDTPGTFGADDGSFSAGGSLKDGALTSNGHAVTVTLSGDTYTGTANGETVFTLHINEDGSYTFDLKGTLDHADGTDANDVITLNFGVAATDSDGDTATATLTINVRDDAPVAHDDHNSFNGEDSTTSGNVITGDHGGAGAADTLSHDQGNHVTQVTFGSTTVDVPATGTTTITGDHGTLTIAADGSYSYTLADGTHGDTADTFVYTLTDGDGDTSTANLLIDSDGTPVIFNPNDPEESPGSRTVDETDLPGGASVNGVLHANFFTDTPGTFGADAAGPFSAGGSIAGTGLTSDGHPVTVTLEGNTYTGAADGHTVFTLQIGSNGAYTFQLDGTLDHADGSNPNDIITLNFGVAATDSDGDTATATLTIKVLDDAPVAHDDVNSFNGEDVTTSGNVITGDHGGPGAADTLSQDGGNHVTQVTFGSTTVDVPATGTTTIAGDHGTLTIAADGSYSYTLADGTHGDTADQFTYSLVDSDGDVSTAHLTIDSDGVPVIFNPNDPQESPGTRTVDETDLPAGTASVNGVLHANFFTDTPGTFGADASGPFSADGSVAGTGLTSNGHPVTVTLVGNTYTGTADGHTVFTLTIGSNGAYTFQLDGTLDHADGSDPNDVINLNFGVSATDSDGDTATATLTIKVLDDAPLAHDDVNNFNGEDLTTTGNVITGDHGGPGAADTVSADAPNHVTQVSFGSTTVDVPATGTTTIAGDHGTLTIAADGSYSYTLADGTHGDTADQFTYTLKDNDGDTSTAHLSIDSDGVPVIFNPNDPQESPGTRTVDETDLPAGTASVNGVLHANFFTDTPGTFGADASGPFSADGSVAGTGLTSNGHPVTVTLVGNTYTGTADGHTVFTLTIGSNGAYTFQLDGTLDHADGSNPNDVINLNFGVAATDSDGDTATATLTIKVLDDAPLAHDDVNNFNGEDHTTTGNVITGDHGGPGAADALSADTPNHVSQVTFGSTTVDVPASGTVSIAGDHGTLTIAADGSYSYTLADGTHGDTADQFTYTLKDGDGDTSTAHLSIGSDGVPVIFNPNDPEASPGTRTVDETNLDPTTGVNGQLNANFFTDTPGSFSATGAATFTAGGSLAGGALTSDGHPVTVTMSGNTYTGTADGHTVFTLTIGSNGAYTFELDGTLDHADGANPNDVINLNFGVTATDSDGDSANATLTIRVLDDAPLAHDDNNSFAFDDGHTTGNVITGDHGGPGAADTLSQDTPNHVTQVSFGSTTVDVPTTGTATIHGDHGTLTIAADGSYTYTLDPGANNTGDVSTPHTFTGPAFPTDLQEGTHISAGDSANLGELHSNMVINANTSVSGSITFDGAGYTNSLGAFTIAADGTLQAAQMITPSINGAGANFAFDASSGATELGFFLVANGFNTNNSYAGLDFAHGQLNFVYDYGQGDARAANVTDNGGNVSLVFTDADGHDHVLSGPIYFTTDQGGSNSLNPDGVVHTLSGVGADSNTLTIAFEDLPQGGDYDYNDVIFNVQMTDSTCAPDMADSFTYTLTDGDGDTSTANLNFDVPHDDHPEITTPADKSVDETALHSGNVVVSDKVIADFFCDAPGTITPTGASSFSADGSLTGGALTSGGHAVTVTQTGDTYTGTADGHTVFTLEIHPDGNYTFTLSGTLDHADGSNPNDVINLHFGVTATDADGDTATSAITVHVLDDAPVAHDDHNSFDTSIGHTDGNVVTGANGGAGAADTLSMDVLDKVTQVSFGSTVVDVPSSGTTTINGDHGTLTIAADGSYSYVLNPGANNATTTMKPVIMTDSALGVTVEVDGIQTDAGVQFTVKILAGTADLNGLFLDIGGNGGPILSLGPGNNMDSTNGFDYAIQLGTVGNSDPAVTQTTVTIDGLQLSDLDNGLIGIRATSAGTNQAGSLKLVGSIETETVPADTTDTFHYTLTDSDGDSSSALLTLSGAAPKLIVGTDANDVTGSTTTYATGNGSGQINGGLAGDILVGDVGGATMVNGVKNYNVELILDVSGSMGSLSDHTSKYYLLVQAVNNLLSSLHDYHGGSVTVNITPFDTTAHTGGTFTVTSDAGYANALNFLQHMGGGGTTNYESALQAAISWLNGSGPTHGADTYTYFISDGEPNHYVTSTNSAASGSESESMAQIEGSDGTNEIAQIQALSTEVIGVGINVGTKIANIDLIDSSHHATNVHDAHDLSQVLAAASPLNHIAGVGNDHISGGDGNDIVFGDAMFTDVLASSHGISMPAGSGWSVFEALEASSGWTRADTISYIHGHLTELATESLGSGGEVRSGGNDVLTGDGGDDVIFGQEGNDTISGGDGNDSLWGGSGADTFVFHSTESGVDHIKDFSAAQGDKIDISDVVASFDPLTDSLHNFVNVVVSGTDSIVQVDPTGTGHAFHTVAVLEGVHTDADTLFAAGNLIA